MSRPFTPTADVVQGSVSGDAAPHPRSGRSLISSVLHLTLMTEKHANRTLGEEWSQDGGDWINAPVVRGDVAVSCSCIAMKLNFRNDGCIAVCTSGPPSLWLRSSVSANLDQIERSVAEAGIWGLAQDFPGPIWSRQSNKIGAIWSMSM